MKIVYEKDRNSKVIFLKKTCEFYAPDLGDLLIGELERAFSEPLDDIDMDEEQARRIKESF